MASSKPRQVAEDPTAAFRRQLSRLRTKKLWTQQDLAERISQLGAQMDRATIAKIETGKRGVSIDDLFVIAAALNVSPLALLLPSEREAVIYVAPTVHLQEGAARVWCRGSMPLPDEQGGPGEASTRFYFDAVSDAEASVNRKHQSLDHALRYSGVVQIAAEREVAGEQVAPELLTEVMIWRELLDRAIQDLERGEPNHGKR